MEMIDLYNLPCLFVFPSVSFRACSPCPLLLLGVESYVWCSAGCAWNSWELQRFPRAKASGRVTRSGGEVWAASPPSSCREILFFLFISQIEINKSKNLKKCVVYLPSRIKDEDLEGERCVPASATRFSEPVSSCLHWRADHLSYPHHTAAGGLVCEGRSCVCSCGLDHSSPSISELMLSFHAGFYSNLRSSLTPYTCHLIPRHSVFS